ncbi:cation-independent mannose-6-phosphate receptor-like [Cylas formicarius]|uniref:cation-independent mannose-6-phosphate receptor-like n=1 Tax=Cylas formicarius TaxID=197179 RepID=UPI00295873AA|nr:cation-independent mannose-6-phosphate receptor-like [Cylas formicarius]
MFYFMLYITSAMTIFKLTTQNPIIVAETELCSYSSSKNGEILRFISGPYEAKRENTSIFFTLCKTEKETLLCPGNSIACLSRGNSLEILNLGFGFELNEWKTRKKPKGTSFVSIHGDQCNPTKNYTLTVKYKCHKCAKDIIYSLTSPEECSYEIVMEDPHFGPCKISIHGQIFDLKSLEGSLSTRLMKGTIFYLNLCQANKNCISGGEEVYNACKVTGNRSIAVSTIEEFLPLYNEDRNMLQFRGHMEERGSRKIIHRLEVSLKCRWDKHLSDDTNFHYLGREGKFELESSFGCVVNRISCIVRDKFLIYNLTGLYSSKPVKDNNSNTLREIYINMCASLQLPDFKNCTCTKTYSQVCEKLEHDKYVNRGSVLRTLEVSGDVLKAGIESGMQCADDSTRQYRTFVSLSCANKTDSPLFENYSNCDTHLSWKTSYACPQFNAASCSHIEPKVYDCYFIVNGFHYDLKPLMIQKSIINSTKEFLFNICGSLVIEDAPCMKDVSVAVTNLLEFNNKHRTMSLGKLAGSRLQNGDLVLEYKIGSYCKSGVDFTSEIRFECGIEEEMPYVESQTECEYKFVWKTEKACSLMSNHKGCSFVLNNKKFDFNDGVQSKLKITSNGLNYVFDVCHEFYEICSMADCSYHPIKEKVIQAMENRPIIKLTLSDQCDSSFNVVLIEFVCDQCKECTQNEHIEYYKTENCVLHVHFVTASFCVEQDLPAGNHPAYINEGADCVINNPIATYQLSLAEPYLPKFISSNGICPRVVFNNSFGYTQLIYTDTLCSSPANQGGAYEMILRCNSSSVNHVVKRDVCRTELSRPEFCAFFESSSTNSSLYIGIGIGLLILLSGLVFATAILKRRSRSRQQRFRNVEDSMIYEKDTEL